MNWRIPWLPRYSSRFLQSFRPLVLQFLRLPAILLPLVVLRLDAQTPPPTAFQIGKARALLRTQLSCLGCHELDGEGGRTAPSLTTVAQRRSLEYIRAIVRDPTTVAPTAAMPTPVMSAAISDLIIAYLTRGANSDSLVALTTASRPVPRAAKDLYAMWCASCHGATGRGDGPNARYLPVRPAIHASAEQMKRRSDDALFDAISGGGSVMGKSPRMPAFGATLNPSEIRALVAYIRVLCACSGPAWSLDQR